MDGGKRENENHEAERAEDSRKRQCKRYETAINSSAEEFHCPITKELPVDPVTAGDGRVYERDAIEEYMEKRGLDLKSPMTNEPMGTTLRTAFQVRNAIEQLVDSGAIDGEKAMRWKEESEQRKRVETLRQKAESGDTDAMFDLALCYARGRGVKKDYSLAYAWSRKAADDGHVGAASAAGFELVVGDANHALGMLYLGSAKEAGCDAAVFWLGKWFCTGAHGLPRDPVQGKKLLSKIVDGTCKFKICGQIIIEEASNLLKELDGPARIAAEPS